MNELLRRIDFSKPPADNAAWLQSLTLLVLELVRGRPRLDVEAAAAELATLMGQWRSTESGAPASEWRTWYVGLAHGWLTLLRTALAQELPAGMDALARRKHVARLLAPLTEGDRTLSDLADVTSLDLSYVDREIARLAAAGAVRTEKHGRERWVALTATGGSLFELARRARRGAAASRVEHTLAQVLTAVNELGERQQALEQLVSRAPAAARDDPGPFDSAGGLPQGGRPKRAPVEYTAAPRAEWAARETPHEEGVEYRGAEVPVMFEEMSGEIFDLKVRAAPGGRGFEAVARRQRLGRLLARVQTLSADDDGAAEAVRQARVAWDRLRPLSADETRRFEARFAEACQRVLEQAQRRAAPRGGETA